MQIVLVDVTEPILDADLAGDRHRLETLLDARVAEWPPVGGEWDTDAMGMFRRLLGEQGFHPLWGPKYVVVDGRLVGSAGFFGPPDDQSEVEIGYSVCASERRRGIATATVAELRTIATQSGAQSLRARTTTTNTASLLTLQRNGFEIVIEPEPETANAELTDGGHEVLLRVIG